jgi:hypothetical protein
MKASRKPSKCVTYTGADAVRIVREQDALNAARKAQRVGAVVRRMLHSQAAGFSQALFTLAGAFVAQSRPVACGVEAARIGFAFDAQCAALGVKVAA